MDRSLRAVLLGTFTLRFSTGLTGSMLAFYLAHLHEHGGPEVNGAVVGLYAALFYLAELVLSPLFGILSDRIGHHKVMLYGPVFGAVAVVITAVTTNLVLLGGTRILEGAVGRGQRALDPRLHRHGDGRQRGPPGQDRRPGSRRPPWPAWARARSSASSCSRSSARWRSSSTPCCTACRSSIYRFGVVAIRRGERAAVAGEHVRVSRVPRSHPDVARVAARTDLDRGQRGARRVARASRSSSWPRATRSSRTSC